MNREHIPARERTPIRSDRLYAALFAGAYALLLVDLFAKDFGQYLLPLLAGTVVVLLGALGFPLVERHRSHRLTLGYFGLQLLLGVAVFHASDPGGTFLLLTIVGQSVRVLPLWGTVLLGAPLPFLHLGMEWPEALRSGVTFLVALVYLLVLSQALMHAERAHVELDEANHQLRDYAAQSEELATARERNRIAREIHDGLGHYLTTIHMQIQAARSILSSDQPRAEQTLAKAQQLAQEALGDVRRSVAALRAPVEQQLASDSLARLAEESQAAGLPTALTILGEARQLDPQQAQAIYRAAQEGLTNARKHAAATIVHLTLDFRSPVRVRLTVADDGCGASATDGGFGLVGLRERVQLVGGSLTLQTAPGAGLVLTVEVPG